MINRLESYRIQTQVFNFPYKPVRCEFTLNYDATEDYDSGFFISDTALKLYNQSGQRIGFSEYHVLRGSVDVTKHQENKIKINRLMDF